MLHFRDILLLFITLVLRYDITKLKAYECSDESNQIAKQQQKTKDDIEKDTSKKKIKHDLFVNSSNDDFKNYHTPQMPQNK